MESYLAGGKDGERQKVFSGVGVLIYVFDVESREFETDGQSSKDLDTYAAIVKALEECSPQARVFALVHKMDLVQTEYKDRVLEDKAQAIRKRSGRFSKTIHTYGTSIWDQTLYKAWGMIVHSLIPNLEIIESVLSDLAETTDAEEIILFEQSTFLMITSVKSEVGKRNPYDDRYERLSNIIKTFKSSLGYLQDPFLLLLAFLLYLLDTLMANSRSIFTNSSTSHQFGEFSIKTPRFNLIISRLTTNTYALIVLPPGETELQCTRLNLLHARDRFAQLDGLSDRRREKAMVAADPPDTNSTHNGNWGANNPFDNAPKHLTAKEL